MKRLLRMLLDKLTKLDKSFAHLACGEIGLAGLFKRDQDRLGLLQLADTCREGVGFFRAETALDSVEAQLGRDPAVRPLGEFLG